MPHEEFTDMQQTAKNCWQARYHGNYGVYTVKIEFDENGRRKNFSCTCPSDGYPCKHIGFLQNEIKQKSAKIVLKNQQNELTVEENIQIESFCKLAVEKRIAEKRYKEAKLLISDFQKKHTIFRQDGWNEYLFNDCAERK